jgi:ATP adenylyltransferase
MRHVGELKEMDDVELAELSELLQRSIRALKEGLQPHGFNLGMNLGRVAGAGVPDHIHWHMVPRWNGDTNFMSVVGQTRVLPELLAETWGKLRPNF